MAKKSENPTKRNISIRKEVVKCSECQREFIAEIKTKAPKFCPSCAKSVSKWEVIGEEQTQFGIAVIQKNARTGKIRKILK